MAMRRESIESEATRFRTATEEYVRLHPEDRFTTDFVNPFRGSFPRPVIVVADGESAWHDTFKPHRPFLFDVPSHHPGYIRSARIAALMQPLLVG